MAYRRTSSRSRSAGSRRAPARRAPARRSRPASRRASTRRAPARRVAARRAPNTMKIVLETRESSPVSRPDLAGARVERPMGKAKF